MKKLVSTTNLTHEEWLRYRKTGIGGSDAGVYILTRHLRIYRILIMKQ